MAVVHQKVGCSDDNYSDLIIRFSERLARGLKHDGFPITCTRFQTEVEFLFAPHHKYDQSGNIGLIYIWHLVSIFYHLIDSIINSLVRLSELFRS